MSRVRGVTTRTGEGIAEQGTPAPGPLPPELRRRWTRRVAITGLAITAAFVVVHLINHATAGLRLLDLNKESNLPTWWSSFVFTVAGLVSLTVGLADRAARQWIAVGVLMLALGLDDIAMLHERMEDKLGDGFAILVIEPILALGVLMIFLSAARSASHSSRVLLLCALVALVFAQGSSSISFIHDSIPIPEVPLTALEESSEIVMGVLVLTAAIDPLLAAFDRLLVRR